MNKVILIGRLSRDPELNFTAGSGTAVTRFNLAINRMKRKDQEKVDADFPNCIAFGKTAETIAQYFTKGKPIAIVGRIQTGSYDAKDGTKRYTTDVVVESFEFVGSKSVGASTRTTGDDSFNNNFDEDMRPVETGDMPF